MAGVKVYKVLVFLVFLFLLQPSLAQDIPNHKNKNLVRVNVIPLPLKSFNILYERGITEKQSVGLSLNYYINNAHFFKYFDSRWFASTIEYRYYLNSTFQGLYFNPYLKYRYIINYDRVYFLPDNNGLKNIPTPAQTEVWHYIGGGAALGYSHSYNSGFNMGAFAGLGYYPISFVVAENPSNIEQNQNLRTDIRLGFTLGWAF
jgi:hypothetical protein